VNPSDRYQIEFALLTSPEIPCTRADVAANVCNPRQSSQTWTSVIDSSGGESLHSAMRRLLKTRGLDLVFSMLTRDGAIGQPKGEQSSFRFARGWARMHELGITAGYEHVLIQRPDAILVRPLLLRGTCRRYPGLNIISGNVTRAFPFHTRDWDWAQLACDPKVLDLWYAPYYWRYIWCDSRGAPSWFNQSCPFTQLPAGFDGHWDLQACLRTAATRVCASAELIRRQEGMRLGNLDGESTYAALLTQRKWL